MMYELCTYGLYHLKSFISPTWTLLLLSSAAIPIHASKAFGEEIQMKIWM